MAAAQAQGVWPTGRWFAHHRAITAERFDFDICVPVSASVDAVGRVDPWTRPALDAVRTVYQGPYEGLGDTWRAFEDWIAANGVQAASDVCERCLGGPESTPDTTRYRTELCRPLVGA
jgi:effector-binding domain-containing protein